MKRTPKKTTKKHNVAIIIAKADEVPRDKVAIDPNESLQLVLEHDTCIRIIKRRES